MTIYMQRREGRDLETVDEFSTRKEARAMLTEYSLADRSGRYYLSTRPCKDWRPITEAARDVALSVPMQAGLKAVAAL